MERKKNVSLLRSVCATKPQRSRDKRLKAIHNFKSILPPTTKRPRNGLYSQQREENRPLYSPKKMPRKSKILIAKDNMNPTNPLYLNYKSRYSTPLSHSMRPKAKNNSNRQLRSILKLIFH
jgi:hypothetical protein